MSAYMFGVMVSRTEGIFLELQRIFPLKWRVGLEWEGNSDQDWRFKPLLGIHSVLD